MNAVITGPGTRTVDRLLMLDPIDQATIPWQPVGGCLGVRAKDLWESPDAVCALIAYAPGAGTPGRPHAGAAHHIWVVAGVVVVAGRQLPTGSYVHVPPGIAHPVWAVGPDEAVLLHLHERSRPHHGAPG